MTKPARADTTRSNGDWPPAGSLFRFSLDQYHDMGRLGIIAADARVELLEGWIVQMHPIGAPHRFVVDELYRALAELIPGSHHVYSQQPVTFGSSEPVPDMVVVRGDNREFRGRHPGAAEIDLIVEVADTTLQLDRNQKSAICAAAEIAEYWIINLPERQAEIHRQPRAASDTTHATYETREVVPADGRMSLVLEGKKLGEIGLADVLP